MTRRIRYSQEVRERAVRMVIEHEGDYASQWEGKRTRLHQPRWPSRARPTNRSSGGNVCLTRRDILIPLFYTSWRTSVIQPQVGRAATASIPRACEPASHTRDGEERHARPHRAVVFSLHPERTTMTQYNVGPRPVSPSGTLYQLEG
jgi:hypothetical protein